MGNIRSRKLDEQDPNIGVRSVDANDNQSRSKGVLRREVPEVLDRTRLRLSGSIQVSENDGFLNTSIPM